MKSIATTQGNKQAPADELSVAILNADISEQLVRYFWACRRQEQAFCLPTDRTDSYIRRAIRACRRWREVTHKAIEAIR